jgi:hypothetical protein
VLDDVVAREPLVEVAGAVGAELCGRHVGVTRRRLRGLRGRSPFGVRARSGAGPRHRRGRGRGLHGARRRGALGGGRRCGRRCLRSRLRCGPRERVHAPERGGHRFERGGDGRELRRLRLKLGHGDLEMRERCRGVRQQLRTARALDLVQRAHRLRDGCRELEQLRWHVGICLEGVQTSSERFASSAREGDGVGHGS